jgi:hypothetical protein
MHYRHRHCNLQIGPLDDFLKVMDPVRRLETGEIDVTAGSLPARTEVWALPPLCVRPGA